MGSNYCTFYLAALFFYITDVLQKTSSKGSITWQYLFKRSCFTSVIAIALTILFFGIKRFPSFLVVLQISFCSILCGLGLFFYIKSINALKFSNVGSLTIVGNVIQQLTGILLFGEKYTASDFVAYGFMSFGCVYQLLFTKTLKGARFVLLSTIFWTGGYILLSRVLQQTTIYWSVPIMEVTIMIMGYILMKLTPLAINTTNTHNQHLRAVNPTIFIVIGLLTYFGSLLNNNAFKNIPISTISILQLSIMPFAYLFSLKLFKEKPDKVELISFITGFIGFALFVYMH